VQVGPLRGQRGHGLQLYSTDEDGTRHPIDLDANSKVHDALAERLLSEGACVGRCVFLSCVFSTYALIMLTTLPSAAGGIVDIVANVGAPSAYTMRAREVSVHGSGDAAGALAHAAAVSVEMTHVAPTAVVE
jgi:hypothetical protein